MYTFGFKWFEKPLWVINIKFYDVIVTDMFHKSINTESEVSRSFAKMLFLTVSQYPQERVRAFHEKSSRILTD